MSALHRRQVRILVRSAIVVSSAPFLALLRSQFCVVVSFARSQPHTLVSSVSLASLH